VTLCPHCDEPWGGHVCADTEPWTQAEKDEARRIMRYLDPRIQFAPSTAVMQDRFGARNRADRLAA
jgi:hypothetical protein